MTTRKAKAGEGRLSLEWGVNDFRILSNVGAGDGARRPGAEGFEADGSLEQRLKGSVRGEVRFDAGSRALYATDASNYRQVPIGLVVPRDVEDVEATMAACREFGAPVLARGGGTSLAGQCCNVAVVLDFSKYMGEVLGLDAGKKRAWVQPGVVLDKLRARAEEFGLTFAPDPATHSRCTLGGMIGNNSCGVHALMGGKTVDNIAALEVLLYDGTRMRVGRTSEEELEGIIAGGGRRGEIYKGLKGIRDRYASLIRERFPRIPRRVSGYNLDELLPENGFNVARALVGSEGTCVTVLEAECELTHSPQHRRLVALGFGDGFLAADYVPAALEHGPIGLEGMDGALLDGMKAKGLAVEDVRLLPEGRGFLLCEFGGDSVAEVEGRVEGFVGSVRAGVTTVRVYSEADAERVWRVRESALGATVFVPGQPHRWEGWEDSAVPPERLGVYLRELFELLGRFGYDTPMYGHFGQGCVHLRINFDLESKAGIAKYREFIELAADVVLKYGGSISGEHGDGQARAALLPKMFGAELMEAFREFKALWDPGNRMNPGKLIDPVRVNDPAENLRLGAGYKALETRTHFAFPGDHGSFAHATLRCVGVGACRKVESGTMCPSYMATREEKHSTRGRARLLWELMQGDVIGGEGEDRWRNEEVKGALDLCLSCKACKTECPVSVDMATWKAEFLAKYYDGRRHPLGDYAFGFMDQWARLASFAPGVANGALKVPGVEGMVKRVLHIAPQRRLPGFAARDFWTGFHRRKAERTGGAEVLLWPDTWNNYLQPEVLEAAETVLSGAGFRVSVPKAHVCCGRPLYDFGFLEEAKGYLARILRRFAGEIDSGVPVVMLEPSCASVFTDELLNFFPKDERARKLAKQTVLFSDFVGRHREKVSLPDLAGREVVVHGHCHQKANGSMNAETEVLRAAGARVRVLDSGCCGMAGPFGFEADKYEVSQTLAERVLLPAVREARKATILVTDGFSCREQIAQNSERRAVHLAQVLAEGSVG